MKTAAVVATVISLTLLMCRADEGSGKAQEEVLPQTTNGNFVLYVSNQSSDTSPVDITVHIDEKKAVSADFAFGNGHSWGKHTFQLAPGKHRITAVSQQGSARMEKEIEIKDKHWAVIDYFSTKRNGKIFSFKIKDRPIMFM